MNLMIQTPVTTKQARKFIEYMERCGYTVIREGSNISFNKDGDVSIKYAVSIIDNRKSFIGIRPD